MAHATIRKSFSLALFTLVILAILESSRGEHENDTVIHKQFEDCALNWQTPFNGTCDNNLRSNYTEHLFRKYEVSITLQASIGEIKEYYSHFCGNFGNCVNGICTCNKTNCIDKPLNPDVNCSVEFAALRKVLEMHLLSQSPIFQQLSLTLMASVGLIQILFIVYL